MGRVRFGVAIGGELPVGAAREHAGSGGEARLYPPNAEVHGHLGLRYSRNRMAIVGRLGVPESTLSVSMRPDDEILRLFLPDPSLCGTMLDCAAGIGTPAIALATMGYSVEGSDSSEALISHAQASAGRRGLSIPFRVDDVRRLEAAQQNHYGAALALDNVLPHLG